jgi:uncharacterized protein (UPF0264 family)
MTGILVSVRDAWEAGAALQAGASVIDVKEPRHGSLGPADPACWHEVARVVDGQVPVSAALGELLDGDVSQRIRQLPPIDYAKMGLARCADQDRWASRWHDAMGELPAATAPVAVAYADWATAGAPHPEAVLERAIDFGVSMLLLDTFGKRQGWLLDHLTPVALRRLAATARCQHVGLVLAGSLNLARLPHVLALAPDLVAVRGAICDGQRSARLVPERVRQWVAAARHHQSSAGAGASMGRRGASPPKHARHHRSSTRWRHANPRSPTGQLTGQPFPAISACLLDFWLRQFDTWCLSRVPLHGKIAGSCLTRTNGGTDSVGWQWA